MSANRSPRHEPPIPVNPGLLSGPSSPTVGRVKLLRILVADRQRAFAEALAQRLDAEPDLRTVGTVATGPGAEAAVDLFWPDVVVLDLALPGGSVVALTDRLRRRERPVEVVGLLGHDDPAVATDAIRAGAAAVVTRETAADDVVAAIVAVGGGGAWIPPHLLRGVLSELSPVRAPNAYGEKLVHLTEREREVLDHMVAGLRRDAIARELFLSINTVRTHTKNILAKLDVHSSLEAVSVVLKAQERTLS